MEFWTQNGKLNLGTRECIQYKASEELIWFYCYIFFSFCYKVHCNGIEFGCIFMSLQQEKNLESFCPLKFVFFWQKGLIFNRHLVNFLTFVSLKKQKKKIVKLFFLVHSHTKLEYLFLFHEKDKRYKLDLKWT